MYPKFWHFMLPTTVGWWVWSTGFVLLVGADNAELWMFLAPLPFAIGSAWVILYLIFRRELKKIEKG